MSDHRKPPREANSRAGSRREGAPLPADSGGFSLENTTTRLKSLRLRRAEAATQEAATQEEDAAASHSSRDVLEMPRGGPSGRVRHDERGVAVWDWAVATGEFAALSTTRALKKLEVADLKIDDHKPTDLKVLEVSGRDKAGGFDPYNQRGSGKRQGEAAERAGITGSASRERPEVFDPPAGKK